MRINRFKGSAALVIAVMISLPLAMAAPSSAAPPTTLAADQCPQAATKHTAGGWACFGTVVKTNAERQKQLVDAGMLSVDAAALSQGYCTYQGCWTFTDSTHGDFVGSVYYFYGSTQVGQVTLQHNWTIAGYTITAKPFYAYSTRSTRTTVLHGDRLYLSSAHPEGYTESSGAYKQQTSCGLLGSYVSCQWLPSTGYSTRETTVQKVSIFGESVWSDTSSAYPGHWYTYAKSIIAYRDSTGLGYRFSGTATPTTPALAGWSAT